MKLKVLVQEEDFDLNVELREMRCDQTQIGAQVSFVGIVREMNQASRVDVMELEHYPGMTEQALTDIAYAAQARWSLQACTIIHRIGRLKASDQIVLVAIASAHRGEAFAACEFVMDFLKTQAPFWKKESTATGAHWVDARESDATAMDKWQIAPQVK